MPWLLHLGLNNAAVAALLAVPALVASRWGRRPALAHALWLLVLVKLVTPSFVPLRILPPAATAEPPAIAAAPQAPPAATTDSRIVFKPKSAAPARQPDLYDLLPPEVKMVLPPRPEEPLAQDDSFVEEEEFPPPSKANELEAPPAAPSPRPNAAFNTANMLSAVWLAGTAVWLGLALLRVRRFGVLLRNAEAAPP